MNIKQIFCRHIWQTIEETPIRSYKTVVWDTIVTGHWTVYALEEKCMKCNKVRLRETSVNTDLK